MKKLELILVSIVLIICTSYTQTNKESLSEQTLQIKKSLDKTEKGVEELKKILNDPYYKYKIK